MEEVKRKRGRPVVGAIYNTQCKFRTSDQQKRRLRIGIQLSGKSQSDILREALDEKLDLIGVPSMIQDENDEEYMYDGYDYYDDYGEYDD